SVKPIATTSETTRCRDFELMDRSLSEQIRVLLNQVLYFPIQLHADICIQLGVNIYRCDFDANRRRAACAKGQRQRRQQRANAKPERSREISDAVQCPVPSPATEQPSPRRGSCRNTTPRVR